MSDLSRTSVIPDIANLILSELSDAAMHNNAGFGVDYWAFFESSNLSTLNLCHSLCDILHYDDV